MKRIKESLYLLFLVALGGCGETSYSLCVSPFEAAKADKDYNCPQEPDSAGMCPDYLVKVEAPKSREDYNCVVEI